jgi:hypothetical protein
VAVDISNVDPILNMLNNLFRGTPYVREKLEAWTLLRDLAREKAAGNVTDAELKMYVREVAESIASTLARGGKAVPVEALIDELYKQIAGAALRDLSTFSADVRRRLRAKRERARVRSEIESLL